MVDVRRNDKPMKKDQKGPREVIDETNEQIRSSGTKPRIENPNRDRARGDWDRTGDHHDEDVSD
ncbi:MAG: hypothetical protein DMG04_13880 [Acidobacteria bacterium]|nr:MAG: hypothetical protein DMG04_13880 [Acidobacteriota bacterium]PYQ88700.1 MAG: hypothetical protein DMG03_03465 [Acidobacteriota bacterium]PYQ89235.1 MAG: hypothetical protein DMG02_13860 [Acidobacteriota bacterium]PYR07584.1 MAG: hypothetical protein DMF99_22120 [Acidobacteriota bacterium]PYR13856.1 MAG: hypothetical protein DMG00_05790 [Acidobacteriota bacterium]